MEINLNADPAFREMVKAEVLAALLTGAREDLSKGLKQAIAEGVRRAEIKVLGFISTAITEAVSGFATRAFIQDNARQAVRELVRETLINEVKAAAADEVKKFDIGALVKAKFANLKVSIIA
jgi:hypothetical protein